MGECECTDLPQHGASAPAQQKYAEHEQHVIQAVWQYVGKAKSEIAPGSVRSIGQWRPQVQRNWLAALAAFQPFSGRVSRAIRTNDQGIGRELPAVVPGEMAGI